MIPTPINRYKLTYVFFLHREGPSTSDSSYISSLMVFTQYLNATLAPSHFYDGYGFLNSTTKTFTGLYGGLESGQVHIALWMVTKNELEEIISTTSDGIMDGFTFFTRLPKNLGNADPLVALFQQLDVIVLAYHVACIVLIVVTVVMANPREKWTQRKLWFSTLAGVCRLIPQQDINAELEKYSFFRYLL